MEIGESVSDENIIHGIREKHKPNHKNNQIEKRQAKGYLLLILLLEYHETALISKSKCMVA